MLAMNKLWITEYIDAHEGTSIGPYIKADTIAKASRIAIQYGLLVLGEIQELQHNEQELKKVVH